jgi:hypothetical protein
MLGFDSPLGLRFQFVVRVFTTRGRVATVAIRPARGPAGQERSIKPQRSPSPQAPCVQFSLSVVAGSRPDEVNGFSQFTKSFRPH